MSNFPPIAHVALTVRDLEVSVPWYTALLGAEPVLDEDTGPFRHVVWSIGATLLGLHEFPDGDASMAFDERRPGLDHVAFACADRDVLDGWRARLDELGIAHGGIVDASYGSGLSFRDPDGLPLELFAPPRCSATGRRAVPLLHDNGVVQQRLGRVVTADGIGLSDATVGTGRPLVYVTGWLSHLRLSWELPAERAFYEALAHGSRLVRYDRAGCGLSDATTRPPSLDDELAQLDVVSATLGPERFDLIGTSMGAPVAAAWAAAHPASDELDIGHLLADVAAPTLVVHREHDRAAPLAQAEALAAGIAGAQLIVLPGRSHLPYFGDWDELARVIRRFLGLRAARRRTDGLTSRQQEVAALVSDGCTNREIATRLGIDERSAEGHVERIRLRLGFRSRAQIAAWYAASGGRR